ncbi:hypothetical protein ALP05_200204 [Pseudomonas caricapapayae]|uniref:Uncharacterized protein n=1 Tax=Pseudomonas caricapapayae TaxID=46678 RepID=A0A3M6ERW6_9PSED|nr:hypothetical protein ALP05_200204 [Pseudomonas caricapapayae]
MRNLYLLRRQTEAQSGARGVSLSEAGMEESKLFNIRRTEARLIYSQLLNALNLGIPDILLPRGLPTMTF